MAAVTGVELKGYFPGVIGRITMLHAVYYDENWGLDRSFEIQVGIELSAFMEQFDEKRDGFWAAHVNGEFSGAIAVDGSQSDTQGARIRWFIVDEKFHNMGIGRALLDIAMAFCRDSADLDKVFLWTFKGLDTAKRLYESHGFRLVIEKEVVQWGVVVHEQKFEVIL